MTADYKKLHMLIPNLIIIAGTGKKSGKTSIACRIIEQCEHSGIVSVKITPHFHETTPRLELKSSSQGFMIYEEFNSELNKDTSRMLRAGSSRVFFAKVNDYTIRDAFSKILDYIPAGVPIVCESQMLRHHIEPGLFLIMTTGTKDKTNNINDLHRLPHVEFNLDYLSVNNTLPLVFSDGRWISWHYGY